MLIDFLVLNTTSIFLATILLNTLNLTDKKIYFILIIDLILNSVPIITIIIILLYKLKLIIFTKISENTLSYLLLLIFYYFLFGTVVYGIYNGLDYYIFYYLKNNLAVNVIIYFLGIKYLESEYNLVGEKA